MSPYFNQRRLVVFDLDGTLIDSSEDIAEAQVYAITSVSGMSPDEIDRAELYKMLGKGLEDTFRPFLKPEQYPLLPQMVAAYRDYYSKNLTRKTVMFPGMFELLTDLKASGRYTAIATTKYLTTASALSNHFGLTPYLDFIGASDRDNYPLKPDPYILNVLMTKAGVTPNDTLMVGDTDNDVLCAKNAGTASIAVTWGAWSKDQLASLNPDAIAGDVGQLRNLLLA